MIPPWSSASTLPERRSSHSPLSRHFTRSTILLPRTMDVRISRLPLVRVFMSLVCEECIKFLPRESLCSRETPQRIYHNLVEASPWMKLLFSFSHNRAKDDLF